MQRGVGVLALQGAVQAHLERIADCGQFGFRVRTREDLERCDALIIPGGESTTVSKLLDTSELRTPLQRTLADGLPVLGTCAGLILLAREVKDLARDGHPKTLGGLDVAAVRNAYGGQKESFEAPLDLGGGTLPLHGVFIRAPRIVDVGPEVEVLARLDGDPVWIRQARRHGACFHPELTRDARVHERFLEDAL